VIPALEARRVRAELMEPELENVSRLQRTLRDVIALTALPAVWVGADTRQISVDVSDVVFRACDLDLAYLHVRCPEVVETLRLRDVADGELLPRIRAMSSSCSAETSLSGPRGTMRLSIDLLSTLRGGDILVAGSYRPGFPSDEDRLILRLASNQAGVWLELKETEEALAAESRFRLEANRARDDFFAQLSHELRTPTTAALGWIRVMQNGRLSESEMTEAMTCIEQSARAQARLVDDLLDVSRIVTGKLELSPSLVSLSEVLTNAVGIVRPSAASKQQTLELELRSRELTLVADAQRLQQVFWNLLANAVKFTPPGGTIRVVLVHHAQTAVVVVTDDGAGIPAALLPVIFDRFRQGSNGVKIGGLGLGLAIAREVIDLHGGTIHAESAGENRRSTFTVTLPLHGATDGGGH
jgi:signal transduction histidine kinase